VYISAARLERQSTALTFFDVAPELVVEVLAKDDMLAKLVDKIREYFAAGVKLVWVVDPRARRVHVYRSLVDRRELTEADTLSGDDVLPGFTATAARLFEE